MTAALYSRSAQGNLIRTKKLKGAKLRRTRYTVFVRDQFTCQSCGRVGTPDEGWDGTHTVYIEDDQGMKALHLDHITPYSAGGTSDTDNLRVLCEHCNCSRGAKVDG